MQLAKIVAAFSDRLHQTIDEIEKVGPEFSRRVRRELMIASAGREGDFSNAIGEVIAATYFADGFHSPACRDFHAIVREELAEAQRRISERQRRAISPEDRQAIEARYDARWGADVEEVRA